MQNRSIKSPLSKALFGSWAVIIIFLFIAYAGKSNFILFSSLDDWQHFIDKFLQINFLDYFIINLSSFAGIIIFSFSCLFLGNFVLNKFIHQKQKSDSSLLNELAHIATSILLGFLVLSFVLQGLAILNWLNSVNVFIIIIVCFLLGINFFKGHPFSNLRIKLKNEYHRLGLKDRILLWLSLVIIILSSLLTATRLGYDAVSNYFVDAKLTALHEGIDFARIRQFPVSQLQMGVLYSSLILTFGDQTARLLSWVTGGIVIIFSLALGENLGLSRKARIILLVFLVSTTSFMDLMGDGKTDIQSLAFLMSMLYWLSVEYRERLKSAQILIGIFAGFSMLIRPFNIPLVGSFLFIFYLWWFFDQRRKSELSLIEYLKPVIPIISGVIILGLYYLLINWKITGDPLSFLRSAQNITPQNWQWAIDKDNILIYRLLYPLTVSLLNSSQMLGSITPLLLAFFPFLLIKVNRNSYKDLRLLLIWGGISVLILTIWIWGLFTIFEIRYVLFLWIIIYIFFSGFLAMKLNERENQFYDQFSYLLLSTLLIFSIFRILFFSIIAYTPLDSNNYPICTEIPFCEAVSEANLVAAPGERILTLNAYLYYLQPDLLSCATTPDEYIVLQDLSHEDPIKFWEEIYRQGYEYIIYEENYSQRHLKLGLTPSTENTPTWLTLETIFENSIKKVYVYRIITDNPPNIDQKSCEHTPFGSWIISD